MATNRIVTDIQNNLISNASKYQVTELTGAQTEADLIESVLNTSSLQWWISIL